MSSILTVEGNAAGCNILIKFNIVLINLVAVFCKLSLSKCLSKFKFIKLIKNYLFTAVGDCVILNRSNNYLGSCNGKLNDFRFNNGIFFNFKVKSCGNCAFSGIILNTTIECADIF